MNGFHIMHDGRPVQLLQHVQEMLAARPDVEVLRGQRQPEPVAAIPSTPPPWCCATTATGPMWSTAARKQARIRDLWTRLWGEVERSLDVARALRDEGGVRVSRIDMDLNSDPRFGSHRLHTTAVGYVRAQGYDAHTKPDLLMATWAANVLCQ